MAISQVFAQTSRIVVIELRMGRKGGFRRMNNSNGNTDKIELELLVLLTSSASTYFLSRQSRFNYYEVCYLYFNAKISMKSKYVCF